MKVSLSIVVFDSPIDELRRCISCVFASIHFYQSKVSRHSEFVLFIVNNGSQDLVEFEQADWGSEGLTNNRCRICLIQGHGNIGYGAGHNKAFELAPDNYDVHVYMNPDVLIDVEAIKEGISFLGANQDVAAVSPKCRNHTGGTQYLCKRFPSVLDLALRGFAPRLLTRIFDSRLSAYEMRELDNVVFFAGVQIISGCFMMCRGSAIQKVRGFDSRYFLYFEDFDLSCRLRAEGKLAYLSTMQIIHGGGNAARKGIRHILMFSRSAIRFFNAHGWSWS